MLLRKSSVPPMLLQRLWQTLTRSTKRSNVRHLFLANNPSRWGWLETLDRELEIPSFLQKTTEIPTLYSFFRGCMLPDPALSSFRASMFCGWMINSEKRSNTGWQLVPVASHVIRAVESINGAPDDQWGNTMKSRLPPMPTTRVRSSHWFCDATMSVSSIWNSNNIIHRIHSIYLSESGLDCNGYTSTRR